MDIKSWKIMLAVDDYGSFTRVGAELGYTQSGITQMMKNLEKKVGFPLYIKDHHGIRLTNEAKSLIPAIRTLLNADEVIHQEIAALNGAQRGTIRIGTYLSCSIHWIPKIIREFQQKHPDIIIQVIEGVEGELADWIQERRVDIGFISLQKSINFFLSWTIQCMQLFRKTIRLPKKRKFRSKYSRELLLSSLNIHPEAMCTVS